MKKSQAKRKIGEVRQKAWNDFNKINDVTQNVQFKESPSYWSVSPDQILSTGEMERGRLWE